MGESRTLVDAAVGRLTGMIMSGEIPPEKHLQESFVASLLKMSRTPVRAALARLAEQGLLEPGPWRGWKVRAFTINEVIDAYSVRATLEGMVCRLLAEDRVDASRIEEFYSILHRGDEVLASRTMNKETVRRWTRVNNEFHVALAQACGNGMLMKMIEQAQSIPIVHASFVGTYEYGEPFRSYSLAAQADHYRIVRLIEKHQSSRAEALMREHVLRAAEVSVIQLQGGSLQSKHPERLDYDTLDDQLIDLAKVRRRGGGPL